MTIRFKCPHCQKALSVKDHLAGKKAACPVCKKAIAIPLPVSAPADVESFAAEAFTDKPAEKPPEPVSNKTIDFTCPFCDEEVKIPAELGGKKTPCPSCTKVIKVPLPEDKKPKDWRNIQKTGPSAAMANLPEQLSDAWGTEQKGKVSRVAMEEAGALPEVVTKPVGVGTWIKRGFWVCLLGGAGILLVNMAVKSRDAKREKISLEEVKKYLSKWEPVQQGAYFLAAGEIDVRNFKANDAQNNFRLARKFLEPPKEKDNPLEYDLCLIKLVLAQVEMGGSGDDTLKSERSQKRFDWDDGTVQTDMLVTLQAIRSDEAKATALRDLGCKFLEMDKIKIPIGLAAGLVNLNQGQRSSSLAQLKALKMTSQEEKKEDGEAIQIPAPPTDINQDLTDPLTRLAYTEAFAFKRDYAEARKIANWKGAGAGKVEACVAGAAIALADTKTKDAAKEAADFITEGMDAYKKLLQEKREREVPTWTVLELIRVGSRTSAGDGLKELVDQLPPSLKPRAQLDFFQGQLARNPAKVFESARVEEIGEEKSIIRGFAWEAFARHNTKLGAGGGIPADNSDEFVRPFLLLGMALGEKDRGK